MNHLFRSSNSLLRKVSGVRTVAVICLAAMLAAGGAAIFAAGRYAALQANSADKASPLTIAAVPTTTPAQLEAELITLHPRGFEPAEITRPQGAFLLAVDNRSGLEEIELVIDRVEGNHEQRVRVPRNKLDWRGVVVLRPGGYLVREANHPQWTCQIIVTAQ